ncbi:MAG: acetylxylan esterase [candidate division KSB1 bacterium]|nr:acetylxylan esterase [candidate division KSB1 bacterium]
MRKVWIVSSVCASALAVFCSRGAAQYLPLRSQDRNALQWNVLSWGYESMMEDHVRRVAFEYNLRRSWPSDPEQIARRQADTRARLRQALGLHLLEPTPLNARVTGTLDCGDYVIEKLVFSSLPGVYVTGSVYVPKDDSVRHPAILCPHGHWRHGRYQTEVQARCIGLAKLGYVVLSIDAYGYGERAPTGHREAHFLLPTGLTLEGLQIWDNLRAIDYLLSRPDVDPSRIGITGASGGGNQTMYTAALDERIRAAVPAVSVNTLDGLFFRGIGCACEVVPGILRFADEWDILACIAPRYLFIPSTVLDPIFPVARAREAFLRAKQVFEDLGVADHITIQHFYDRHAYNQELREAMYGWFQSVFRGKPFEPVPEPPGVEPIHDFAELRVFPEGKLPADARSLTHLALSAAKRYRRPSRFSSLQDWNSYKGQVLSVLRENVLDSLPDRGPIPLRLKIVDRTSFSSWDIEKWVFWSDWDVIVPAVWVRSPNPRGTVILAHAEGKEQAVTEGWVEQARKADLNVLAIDLRGTGETREEGRLLVQNNLIIGKPILGEWAWDLCRAIDAVEISLGGSGQPVYLVGNGPAGLACLLAGLLDDRVSGVGAIATLGSYVAKDRYSVDGVYYLPGILQWADIPHLVALLSPRRVTLAGPIWPSGEPVRHEELARLFEPATSAFRLKEAVSSLNLTTEARFPSVVAHLIH